jgi:hypothetical protein
VLLFLFISGFNVTIMFSDDAHSDACFLSCCFFLIHFFQSSGTIFVGPIDFTYQCGFCVLIGFFVAFSFRAVKNKVSESLSISLFDCSEVLVMLMVMFIASVSALNIEKISLFLRYRFIGCSGFAIIFTTMIFLIDFMSLLRFRFWFCVRLMQKAPRAIRNSLLWVGSIFFDCVLQADP